jgi:hypothetical protein
MEYDQNAVYKDVNDYVEKRPDGGERRIPAESFADLVVRVNKALQVISDKYADKHVLMSSHGIFTRAMLISMGSDVIKKADDGHLMIDGPDAGSIPNGKLYELQAPVDKPIHIENNFAELLPPPKVNWITPPSNASLNKSVVAATDQDLALAAMRQELRDSVNKFV